MRTILVLSFFSSVFADLANATPRTLDDLEYMFRRGQQHASSFVHDLSADMLPSDTATNVRDWIIQNHVALAADISASPHVWNLDPATTCGETQRTAIAPINFAFTQCEQRTASRFDAAALLVHESVHHFGIDDESFCDNVAFAVYQAWRDQGEEEPKWENLGQMNLPFSLDFIYSARWFDHQLYVWADTDKSLYGFDPVTEQWKKYSPAIQEPYLYGIASTSSDSLIFWSSRFANSQHPLQNAGYIYSPGTGLTVQISATNAPGSDAGCSNELAECPLMVWTGDKFLVWGGVDQSYVDRGRRLTAGGLFDPHTGRWQPIPAPPFSNPSRLTAVWTGSVMIAYALMGYRCPRPTSCEEPAQNVGAIFDPVQNTWSPIAVDSNPHFDSSLKAVAFGGRMYVFDRHCFKSHLEYCRTYDIASDTWSSFSIPGITDADFDNVGSIITSADRMYLLSSYIGNGSTVGVMVDTNLNTAEMITGIGLPNMEVWYPWGTWGSDSLYLFGWYHNSGTPANQGFWRFDPKKQ